MALTSPSLFGSPIVPSLKQSSCNEAFHSLRAIQAQKERVSRSLTIESVSAGAIFTPKLLCDLNCIGFYCFVSRQSVYQAAFVALPRPVMNAWLKYLSGGGGSLREG